MKNLSLCTVFFFFLTHILAQNAEEVSIDSMLVDIDKTHFTSGVLYDRVYSWSQLATFNDSINISNKKYFEQALYELFMASKEEKFISHKTLRTYYTPDSLQHVVDIGVINAIFHTVNYVPENEDEGALQIGSNDTFEKIDNGKPEFKLNHVFMVSPLKLNVVGEEFVFHFDVDFLLEDAEGIEIVSLVANFDTPIDYTLISNGSIVNENILINYAEGGGKILTVTATFSDGNSLTTQGALNVSLVSNQPPQDLIQDYTIDSNYPFQGYDEAVTINGKLDYRIFYHTSNGNNQANLIRPLIIIDGFDPGDKRQIQDSDPHPDLSNDEHDSIEEMMTYKDSSGNNHMLIDELRALGYDVVIVNHPTYWRNGTQVDGGADFIERNALTHVTLYEYLNTILTQNNSTHELIIVGPSMGGQISRYALAYMEANNIDHNTKLWVSIDSPHLGANIPVGAQTLLNVLKDFTGSVEAQDFVENQLGSPAAKQQLIEQHKTEYIIYPWLQSTSVGQDYLNGRTVSQGFSENRGHPFFVQYYNNLFNNGSPNSKGYPQNLRKIALVNGSLTNTKAYQNPFENNGTEYSGSSFSDTYASNGAQTFKIKGYANIIGHITTMETYAMPSIGNTHKISYFKKKSAFGWSFFDRFITNSNSRGNLDNVPGGWFSTQRDLAHSIENSVPCEWVIGQICVNNWDIHSLEHVNSFIPTVSALGFYNPDFNWSQNFDRNLVCTGEIPFDSYFGPRDNEQHTSFTQESVDWLLAEIGGTEQAPTVYLNPNDLQGPTAVCPNNPVTYDFAACKAPPVLDWEVSSNIQILSSSDTEITVQSTNSSNSSGFIRAIFPFDITVQKDVWVGAPGSPGYLNGPEVVTTGSIVYYSGGVADGATSYEWWLPYPFDVVSPIDYFSDNWQILPNAGNASNVFTGYAGNNGYVQLMGRNQCGLGDAAILYVEHDGGGGGGNMPVVPYPNTSDTEFNLDFSSYPEGTYYIYIYDMYSNIYYQGESSNIEKTVHTSNIPNGLYYLHVHDGNDVSAMQLIIQH
jgi:hypothetical protein